MSPCAVEREMEHKELEIERESVHLAEKKQRKKKKKERRERFHCVLQFTWFEIAKQCYSYLRDLHVFIGIIG